MAKNKFAMALVATVVSLSVASPAMSRGTIRTFKSSETTVATTDVKPAQTNRGTIRAFRGTIRAF